MIIGGGFNALSIGVQGVQRGQQGLAENAHSIANASTDKSTAKEPDQLQNSLTESAVGLIENELQVAASAKVIKAADETLGRLIDTTA